MNNKVSFDGIGEVAATFRADDKVMKGQTVKLDATGKAVPCADNDRFAGVAMTAARDGCATILIGGCVTAAVSGDGVTCGHMGLVADGQGGVKKDSGSAGGAYLVVAVENGMATFVM